MTSVLNLQDLRYFSRKIRSEDKTHGPPSSSAPRSHSGVVCSLLAGLVASGAESRDPDEDAWKS